jgi:predicted metalloprotease with PDZ domain
MRGANLNVFTFDYDLTWAAFFMNADQKIYGRFGGRDGPHAEKYLTLPGLKYAMRAALQAYRAAPKAVPAADVKKARTVEQYSAAQRLKAGACIHCHQVYDFRREELQAKSKWRLEEVWVYPNPENVGLTVAPEQGNRVQTVKADSPAARLGLKAGDVLKSLQGQPVASFADVQHALHLAPARGTILVVWQRRGKELSGKLELAEGWRKTDISWRTSMWGLEPVPGVYGQNLTAEEKKKLGLPEKGMAFLQGNYVPPAPRAAGIKGGDIIYGIDGKTLEMTMLQFNVYIRLNYRVGDRITFHVLREGKHLKLPMVLKGRGG